jgi:amino acid adenylation domain-containing protein
MNATLNHLELTDDELALLEQLNPELKSRLVGETGTDAPLSFPQERIWFEQQTHRGAHHNDHMDLRLTGELNISCLEAAWNQIVLQNEVLRTAFVEIENRPVQRVMPYAPAELPFGDLSLFENPFNEATQRCLALGKSDFDLCSGDVFRVCVFKLGERDHVFHLTTHQLACDKSAWNILQRELKSFYESALTGRVGLLNAFSKVRYADFARWQRSTIDDPDPESLSYWKTQLTEPPTLELPTDFQRPTQPSFRGRRQPLSLDTELTQSLKRFSHDHGGTILLPLLAGLKTLLWRYSGCEDVVVGTPVGGKISSEFRDVVGCFLNLLPLRTKLSADLTAKDVLERVRDVVLGACEHENFPFEKVVEEIKPASAHNGNPFFDVALTVQNSSTRIDTIGDLHVSELDIDYGSSKFDLSINLVENEAALSGWIEYSTSLFEPETVRRMAAHFDVILRALLQQPHCRISELPLLTAGERQQLLFDWNRTEIAFPRDKCVHELFEEQVRLNPEVDAVTFHHTTWTYRELNDKANAVAARLRELGTNPRSLVGVYVERSADILSAILGIWKTGCAYVPLDPVFPPDRIKDIAADAQLLFLITNKHFASNVSDLNLGLVFIEDIPPRVKANAGRTHFDPDNLAYVIYTSGSTGKPKGVQVRHRAVTNALTAMAKITCFTKNDHLAAVTTITFDISVLELFLPLTTGAKVTVIEENITHDGVSLAKTVTRTNPTFMQATPAMWRLLIECGWRGNPRLTIYCGGEALTEDLAKELLQRGNAVWNSYGPTETTIYCTAWKVEPGKPISIGRPLGNLQAYILDKQLQPVPIGAIGELHIGGEGLAAGYLNRPELTAQKFIPHPFDAQSLIYKTGDQARYLPDGTIQCLGRLDDQVKIRGFRIELGEIESVLAQHPAVRQSVVIAAEDISGTKCLVACIATNPGQPIDTSSMVRLLQSKVPPYMIPAEFLFVEKFPLTSSGKVDRKQLARLRDSRTRG